MGRLLVTLAVLGTALTVLGGEGPTLETQTHKASYCLGLSLGKNIKQDAGEVDTEAFVRGVRDGLAGAQPALADAEMREVMAAFQKTMQDKRAQRLQTIAEKNKLEGEAYLAENGKKEGVKTTRSGLQYETLKRGTGATPKATDTVITHYRGTLIDGTEFDSSHKRGQPATFPVNGVIGGWTEALQLMKVGGKWRIVVPSALAYRERGAGRLIGPHATLIFEIELLQIK